MISKPWFRKSVKAAIVILIGALLIYRVRFAPVQVETCKVMQDTIVAETLGTGTLEARVRAAVSPKISGRIAEVLADQGDRVVKGQRLLLLDDEDLRQQVEMAEAEVSVAHAGVEKAESDIQRAEAVEREAKAYHARVSEIASSGAMSLDSLEKAQKQMQVAQAELVSAKTAMAETQKRVIKAQAAYRYAEAQLAYTVVCAPFDGVIVKRNRDPGDVVVPGSAAMEIISLDELWISAWVDETQLGHIAVGQPAKVVFRSNGHQELVGTVARIAPQADRESRELLVDVSIEKLPEKWAIGQRAEVYIQTAHKKNASVIPHRAVTWRQRKPGVFVIENSRARWREITLGIEGRSHVEAVSGVEPDQTLMIGGLKLPREGRRLKVTAP
jgi:HlyD family secretion protein